MWCGKVKRSSETTLSMTYLSQGYDVAEIISGVTIPDSKLAQEATELVREFASQLIYDHSPGMYWAHCAGSRWHFLRPRAAVCRAMFHIRRRIICAMTSASKLTVPMRHAALALSRWPVDADKDGTLSRHTTRIPLHIGGPPWLPAALNRCPRHRRHHYRRTACRIVKAHPADFKKRSCKPSPTASAPSRNYLRQRESRCLRALCPGV